MQILIISAVWLTGYMLAFIMQRTEIAAEKQPYTFGDRLLIAAMSLLSWFWVIVILITSWCKGIAATGYWLTEVNPPTTGQAESDQDRKDKIKVA